MERATLRLGGLQGADPDGIPWVNRLLDAVRGDVGLEHGIALPVWDALVNGDADDLSTLAQKASAGSVRFRVPEGRDLVRARSAARKQVGAGFRRVDARRRERERLVKRYGDPDHQPWIYLIVATGDIYEDMPQAQTGRARGRRHHRGHPVDGAVAARLRPRGTRRARASPAPTPPRRTSA